MLGSFVPFLFVLAIIYGALEVSGVFKNKGAKLIISLCIAFIGITYQPLVEFIYTFLPYAAMFFIVVFFFGFVYRIFRKPGAAGEKKEPPDWTLCIIIGGLLLVVLGWAGEEFDSIFTSVSMGLGTTTENIMWIIGFVLFLGLLWFAYNKGTGKSK
jgi:hypothetical protein